jgi:hypothetical protein
MAEKKDCESEWKEAYKVWEEKKKEFKLSCFRLQKVGKRRINHINKEIEEIPYETPKMKARDKAQKLESALYVISEKVEESSVSVYIVDKGLEDMGERIQAYKSNETREQKKKRRIR